MSESLKYAQWDNDNFVIPEELMLNDKSCLHEAIDVFYKAGGADFFDVDDPDEYAANWLDFIGELYSDIEEGKYKPDGKTHKNPLSEKQRLVLKEQGVPDIFVDDISD